MSSEDGRGTADHHWQDVQGSTSFLETCFNGYNALSGVGILTVPYALSSAGWLGLIFLFLIACCAFYTGLLIKRCMDMDPNIRSYSDIGGRAFGPKGRALISIAMNLELYLVATGFLIIEGDNLHSLFPGVEYKMGSLTIAGKHGFVCLVGLIMLPSVLFDNMRILSYISTCGVIASAILIVSVTWSGAFSGIGFHEKGKLLNYKGIPTAVSLYAFCFCAHPIFPTLYTSMKNQKKFSEVLLICFLVCTMSYASMAIIGYLMFGSATQSQITLNLPTDKLCSKVAIYTTLINPIAKYALVVTPVVNALENHLIRSPNKGFCILIRSCLVLSTIIVALSVPFYGYLMSLVGALLSVTGSVILPCLCFLKISDSFRGFGLDIIVIWCIVVLGFLVLAVGTGVALQEIILHLVKRQT